MGRIQNKKIKLKIVGTENSYSDTLKKVIAKSGLENRIEFLGGVFGDKKFELFANAKAFVAPSYSEAIGMVNLEAAACKTPVITTFETGISSKWNSNGGLMINPNVEELTQAINTVTSWSNEERFSRGENLSNFVLMNYSWEKRGVLWNELYSSL
jgi:glycosyltransferase involved in cell wall biosynthesis